MACRYAWIIVTASALGACGPTIVLSDDATGDSSADEAGATATRGSATQTTGMSATATRGQDTTDGRETQGEDGVTTAPPPPVLDIGGPNCPLGAWGAPCADDDECCSSRCFDVGPLGGVCSECASDDDCEHGCDFGWPLTGEPATCGNGAFGSGCESDGACLPGLSCAPLFEIPGILSSSTCGECASDGQCPPGTGCAPVFEESLYQGTHLCVPFGTQPLDAGCGDDSQCASGHCVAAQLMGIPVITVCSVCSQDADCGAGTCVVPEIQISGTDLALASGACT